jgi:hypothetical protein
MIEWMIVNNAKWAYLMSDWVIVIKDQVSIYKCTIEWVIGIKVQWVYNINDWASDRY